MMAGNTQAIAGNPVRTVRELADAEWSKPTGRVTNSRVEQFLTQVLAEKPEATDSIDDDTVRATPTSYQSQAPVQIVPQSKQRPRSKAKTERQKPIFQQS